MAKKEIIGTSNKVLEVDLSLRKFSIYTVLDKERKLYLGGKGLGLKLIYDRMKPQIDPLSNESIIAFMPGVLMGTGAPCSARFAAIAKSPLTKIMATASCGGPFGMQLKTAGWDGLLVYGKSEQPVYLVITSDGVEFKDANHLWGLNISSTQVELKNLNVKRLASVVIGPAGENLVKYANIASDTRFLGRGGLGAVLGSKNLKAIVAIGQTYKIKPKWEKAFLKVKKTATSFINKNHLTSITYRKFGTNANVNITNSAKILPIRNFKKGSSEKAYEVSGENIKATYNTTNHTCKPCSILCGKKANYDGNELPVPEFESNALLGPNLGIFDNVKIAKLNKLCSDLGLDTISAAGTIAWVMEATEKGLIKTNLKFGKSEGINEILNDIAYGRGFGKEMGYGSRFLSNKYGGKEFAMQVKGLEMAAYDPRGSYGQGLAYAVANRGACHLSAYIVSLEVFFNLLDPHTPYAKPEFVMLFEDLTCCVNSIQTCQFTMFAYKLEPFLTKYTPDLILGYIMQKFPTVAVKLLDFSVYTKLWKAITGISISNKKFLQAGERTHLLERYMNTREGISRKDDTLPDRLLKEGRTDDKHNHTVPLDKMLDEYYQIRGYDKNGIPKPELLKKLQII